MRIAVDVKGTIDGPRGATIIEAFKKLQELGHECVVWSNCYSYATDAIKKHNLNANAMDKASKSDFKEWNSPLFDVAIEDDRNQKYLAANNFIFVDDITASSEALIKRILALAPKESVSDV